MNYQTPPNDYHTNGNGNFFIFNSGGGQLHPAKISSSFGRDKCYNENMLISPSYKESLYKRTFCRLSQVFFFNNFLNKLFFFNNFSNIYRKGAVFHFRILKLFPRMKMWKKWKLSLLKSIFSRFRSKENVTWSVSRC